MPSPNPTGAVEAAAQRDKDFNVAAAILVAESGDVPSQPTRTYADVASAPAPAPAADQDIVGPGSQEEVRSGHVRLDLRPNVRTFGHTPLNSTESDGFINPNPVATVMAAFAASRTLDAGGYDSECGGVAAASRPKPSKLSRAGSFLKKWSYNIFLYAPAYLITGVLAVIEGAVNKLFTAANIFLKSEEQKLENSIRFYQRYRRQLQYKKPSLGNRALYALSYIGSLMVFAMELSNKAVKALSRGIGDPLMYLVSLPARLYRILPQHLHIHVADPSYGLKISRLAKWRADVIKDRQCEADRHYGRDARPIFKFAGGGAAAAAAVPHYGRDARPIFKFAGGGAAAAAAVPLPRFFHGHPGAQATDHAAPAHFGNPYRGFGRRGSADSWGSSHSGDALLAVGDYDSECGGGGVEVPVPGQ